MTLHDSGHRKQFPTGAERDIYDGKGRFDLLPLDIIADRFKDYVLHGIDQYIREGDTEALWMALEQFALSEYNLTDKDIDWTAMLTDAAKQYEAGAKKYSDRNWEKGIPSHCFISSAISHYLRHTRGDNSEPHGRAFVWNVLGALWTHKHYPELVDLPFKTKQG